MDLKFKLCVIAYQDFNELIFFAITFHNNFGQLLEYKAKTSYTTLSIRFKIEVYVINEWKFAYIICNGYCYMNKLS